MRIAVVGTGYVGLVSGACFAEFGVDVTCVDVDASKIEKLKAGGIPIYEPGLDDLVAANVREGRLFFTLDGAEAIRRADAVFIDDVLTNVEGARSFGMSAIHHRSADETARVLRTMGFPI